MFEIFSFRSLQAVLEVLLQISMVLKANSLVLELLSLQVLITTVILYRRIHHRPLEYVTYGKPNPLVFENVEVVLRQILSSHCDDHFVNNGDTEFTRFKTLYMIGDNPVVDIKGAREVRHFSSCSFITLLAL